MVASNTAMFSQVNQFAPEVTGLLDSGGTTLRVIIDDRLINSLATASISDVQKQYETMRAAELRTSPTFDADSSGAGTATITPANFGAGTTIALQQHETATLIFDGTNWQVLATYGGAVA